jgi:hypothetical protein
MTAGQVSAQEGKQRHKVKHTSVTLTRDRYNKVVEYAREENIYITQALERIVDQYFEVRQGFKELQEASEAEYKAKLRQREAWLTDYLNKRRQNE